MIAAAQSRFHEIKASGELPSPTGIALALLELMQRDDATIPAIARLLQGDPALSGRLLKVVNSPLLGRRRPIASVAEAVLLTGVQTLRQIVLGVSVVSAYRKGRCVAFDYQRFWSHSLATAAAAKVLSQTDRRFVPEETFTCGLLAGIGRLALATVYPATYAEVLQAHAQATRATLLVPERERFLTDHVELGTAMLADWGLPALHCGAIGAAYSPAHADEDEADARVPALARYLHHAQQFADAITAGERDRATAIAILVQRSAAEGRAIAQLEAQFDGIGAEWLEWSRILEIPAHEAPHFEELSHAALPPGAANTPTPAGAEGRLRVLLADDDAAARPALAGLLERAGHVVAIAGNGRDAMRQAMEWLPHIVIAARNLPQIDGLSLCRILRDTRHGRYLYIIVLTDGDDASPDAIDAGADDCLPRPVEPRALAARLRAGGRLVQLQGEIEREHDEIHGYLADLAVANRRLEQATLTDPLTGLPNRRYAMRRLRQMWSGTARAGAALACMLVDIDHFKAINETYGHAQGDRALCVVADLLRSSARIDDEVCRIGGEEFLLICANSDAHAARVTAERLRDSVARSGLEHEGKPVPLTVSIGVAVQNAVATDPDHIMSAADEAVHQAKLGGRNRVCLFTTLTEASQSRPDGRESTADPG